MTAKKRISRIFECILLVILFVMFIFPFYWTLITSVKGLYEAVAYPPTFWPSEFHFENYAEAWRHADFAHFGKNSIIMSIGATAFLMLSCTIVNRVMVEHECRIVTDSKFRKNADETVSISGARHHDAVLALEKFAEFSKLRSNALVFAFDVFFDFFFLADNLCNRAEPFVGALDAVRLRSIDLRNAERFFKSRRHVAA